jgi:hypothetical protein
VRSTTRRKSCTAISDQACSHKSPSWGQRRRRNGTTHSRINAGRQSDQTKL